MGFLQVGRRGRGVGQLVVDGLAYGANLHRSSFAQLVAAVVLWGALAGWLYGCTTTWGHRALAHDLPELLMVAWVPAIWSGIVLSLLTLGPILILLRHRSARWRWAAAALASFVGSVAVARTIERSWSLGEFFPAVYVGLGSVLTVLTVAAAVRLVVRAVGVRRRSYLVPWAAAIVAVVGSVQAIHWSSTQRPSPDVILIVVDTLRADHLGFDGYPVATSPRLDEFASESIQFRNAFATAPWTTPSVGSLLTSRYPSQLGFEQGHATLGRGELMLAEVFRAHGYETHAIVAHHFLGKELGFAQGFETWDQSNARGHRHVSSPDVIRRAIERVEQPRDRPLFLMVHLFDPHYDYQVHAEYDFDPDYRGPVQSIVEYLDLRRISGELDERDLRQIRSRYDSEIRFTDTQIGRLFDRLKELGQYEDSLITVTADHGEAFQERGEHIGHGETLFQELIRVPLLIRLPGPSQHRQISSSVSLLDLAPTMIQLAGLGSPPPSFGGELLPLADRPSRAVFSESGNRAGRRSIVHEGWKLIVEGDGEEQLFHLAADPHERLNLVLEAPQVLGGLRQELDRWESSVKSPLKVRAATFSDQQKRELRALGYLQ